MGAGYKAALADPELLSLREEAALLTTRIMRLLNRLKETPPGPAYEVVWTELRDVIRDKAKVTAAEVRRLVTLGGVVTTEQALLFARALLTAAREVVTDRGQLRRLQHRCLQLLPPDEYGTVRANGDGSGTGLASGDGEGTSHDAGQDEGGASTAGPSRGVNPTPTPTPEPAPLPNGSKELRPLPPGADPDDWEWVPEDEEGQDDGVAKEEETDR
jgi:hypothetical protein